MQTFSLELVLTTRKMRHKDKPSQVFNLISNQVYFLFVGYFLSFVSF